MSNMPVEKRKEWIKSRRDQRKLARNARLRRQTFRFMLLATLLTIGFFGFRYVPWYLTDPSQITVKGNLVVTPEQVKSAIANNVSEPLYKVDPKLLEKSVQRLEAVRFAFVRRYTLPQPRITVDILEEFPWASFSSDAEKPPDYVIAQSGRMIPIARFPTVMQPPLRVYGKPNLKMTSNEVAQWASWIALISEQSHMPVQYIDMRSPFDVRVQNGDLYLKLGTPDSSLTRRLGRLTSVMTAIEPMKEQLEYVDLGLDNNIPLKVARVARKDGKTREDAINKLTQATQAGAM